MALREKFGKLVLLEETDSGPIGNEYRAARLGTSGFDRLVTVLRFSSAVSGHAEASKRLVEEARLAAQIHNPGVVRMLGVGRVGASFYVSTELVEGRTLRAILARCREEGFPFAAEHALMIASRAAAVLELLHGRKDDAGRPLLHGLVSPRQLVVAFDGEVKLKGLGLWSALGSTELLALEERAYLAPEQATTKGDPRSDIYALALVLLEALRGQALEGADPLEGVGSAQLASAGGELGPLPRPLAELLRRSLATDPASRFQGMGEFRKAIDALVFSGDFTPTTFDLAFFMHTLLRDEVERDARAVQDASAGDYREFLAHEAAKSSPPPPARSEPFDARPPAPDVIEPLAQPTEVSAPTVPAPSVPEPARVSDPAPPTVAKATSSPGPDSSQVRHAARASRDAGAREAAARLSLGGAPVARRPFSSSLALAVGLIGAVVVGGGAVWLYFLRQRPEATTAAAPSAEQPAADARVRELEARIAQLEREKVEVEANAADEARRTAERQAAAGGQAAERAAVERAQAEARRKARLDQELKQQEELLRVAEEKRVEEQRIAAALAAAAATPAPTALPVPTPTPSPAPRASSAAEVAPAPPQVTATTPGPPVEPALPTPLPATPAPAPAVATTAAASASPPRMEPADASDPAVRPPGLVSEEAVPYPARAIPRRISAVVVVRALVDERGRVAEAVITQASGQPPEYGFDAAALRRVRSRKYRPARREDLPVPIWVVVRVEFRPPPIR